MQSKRLSILEQSLKKKEAVLDTKFNNHFDSVKAANGQPLNDKRNGQATMDKWDRQSDSIRNQYAEIEKTKIAIEIEEGKISETQFWYNKMPKALTNLIDNGTLKQWRKHPRMLLVEGVERARIVFNDDTGVIAHRYVKDIPNKEQYAIFRDLFNSINKAQKEA